MIDVQLKPTCQIVCPKALSTTISIVKAGPAIRPSYLGHTANILVVKITAIYCGAFIMVTVQIRELLKLRLHLVWVGCQKTV